MRPVTINKIVDVINFGKHKGKTLKQIALIDPDYIEWLCKKVNDFIITYEIIDELSEYCLSTFFDDPEAYLSETAHYTTLVSYQHLKYGGKEIILGGQNITKKIADKIKGLPLSNTSQSFSRKVFDGEACKNALKERVVEEINDDTDSYDDDNSIDMEDMRRSYNDAYEIDSNEFDGWHEPID